MWIWAYRKDPPKPTGLCRWSNIGSIKAARGDRPAGPCAFLFQRVLAMSP